MLYLTSFLTAAGDVAADATEAVGELATEAVAVDEMIDFASNQLATTAEVTTSFISPITMGALALYSVICIGLVVVILSQKKRSANPGGNNSIGGTYWDKNKGRSAEGKMELITKWGIAAFMLFAFVISLNLIK